MGDLGEGVNASWRCPLCLRTRKSPNKCPTKRPGKYLVFVKPVREDSLCLSCHNYCRGCCKGFTIAEIKSSLKDNDAKQEEWNSGITDYEAELESSHKGRVSKMDEKFKPPLIIKCFKANTHEARLLMPCFWPEAIYKKIKGSEVPENLKDTYTFRGVQLHGCYLDPVEHPAVAGVLVLSEKESTGASKEQEIANSGNSFQKDHSKKLWTGLEQELSSSIQSDKLEDGIEKLSIKADKRTLKKTDSSSSNDFEWLNTIRSQGASSGGEPAAKKAKAKAKVKAQAKEGTDLHLPNTAASSKKARTSASLPSTSPSASVRSSASTSASGPIIYKSVQVREINSVSSLVGKYKSILATVSNEEGLVGMTVDKVRLAKTTLEKKATASTFAKLRATRDATDEVASEGSKTADELEQVIQQLDALEFLVRGIVAKSSGEAGMFWQAATIRDGIYRCKELRLNLPSAAYEMCVKRQVDIVLGSDRAVDVLKYMEHQKADDIHGFGLWFLDESKMSKEDIAKFQGKTLLNILQKHFEGDASIDKLKVIFKPSNDLSWIMDDKVREIFHQFTIVVWQMDGGNEASQRG